MGMCLLEKPENLSFLAQIHFELLPPPGQIGFKKGFLFYTIQLFNIASVH